MPHESVTLVLTDNDQWFVSRICPKIIGDNKGTESEIKLEMKPISQLGNLSLQGYKRVDGYSKPIINF